MTSKRSRRGLVVAAVLTLLVAAGVTVLLTRERPAAPKTSTPVAAQPTPVCPDANLLKGILQHTAQPGETVTSVSSVTCAGAWAVALMDVSIPNEGGQDSEPMTYAITAVFSYSAGSWQNADRGRACPDGSIPEAIHTLACNSN